MDLKKKILSDPVNRWVFNHAPKETYIVGGYVRDLLRGKSSADKDFVIKGDAGKTAERASGMFGGKLIELHNRQTFRVALRGGPFLDFSPLKTGILDDLRCRDYTVNALAWSPVSGIVCPDNFLQDIEKRIIRCIRSGNLTDDPLRILRAYRLAAEHDFRIEESTRRLLKRHSGLITSAAPERITEELFKLLNLESSLYSIQLCTEDKVLSRLLKLTNDNIALNLSFLNSFEKHFRNNILKFKELHIYNEFFDDIAQGLQRKGFIRLFILLRKYSRTNKRIYRHSMLHGTEKIQPLRISMKIAAALMNLEKAETLCKKRLSGRRQYQLFTTAGDSIFEWAVLQSLLKPHAHESLYPRALDFLHKRRKPLLNGIDIQRILERGPGRPIGEIKERVLENHFLGKISNRREARRFILHYFT